MSRPGEEFAAFLRDEYGDDLRSVGVADGGEKYVFYLRDDVARELAADPDRTDDRIQQIADELVYRELEQSYQEALFALGDRQGSIEVFDEGYVLLLPWDARKRRGAIATFDRSTSLELPDLFDECLRRLPWSDG